MGPGIDRRVALKLMLTGASAGIAGVGGYGFAIGRHNLSVTRADLPVVGLPDAFDGFRIGLMTDVHRSRWVTAGDVAAGVSALSAERPDLTVLGGDYVTWGDPAFVEASAEALAPLTAPHGVFAVIGNHDDERDMPAALTARGIRVLKDTHADIELKDARISLVGLKYWTKRPAEIEAIVRQASSPVILLAHDPRRLTEATALKVPLVLSGHTHGGQVVLPGLGAVAAKTKKFPILSGIARVDRTTLFVSRGLGTVYVPVRINCPPEVAILRLRSA